MAKPSGLRAARSLAALAVRVDGLHWAQRAHARGELAVSALPRLVPREPEVAAQARRQERRGDQRDRTAIDPGRIEHSARDLACGRADRERVAREHTVEPAPERGGIAGR